MPGADNPMGSISSNVRGFYFFGLRKNGIAIWFYIEFFHDFIHALAGEDNTNEVNFEHHRRLLSLRSFAVTFRRTALNT